MSDAATISQIFHCLPKSQTSAYAILYNATVSPKNSFRFEYNVTLVYVSFYNVISVTVFVISDMFYITYTLIHWTH
jgi:hypothetical protein